VHCELCHKPAVFETYSGCRLLCAEHGASWTAYLLAQPFEEDLSEHSIFETWWKLQEQSTPEVAA
jgi:hypothetical protein